MRRSEDRILTTHTGSVPRPPGLSRLYVRQAQGESVDPAELEDWARRRCALSCASSPRQGSTSATTASSSASGYSSTSATA
jgi:hypothetical protein